MMLRSDELLRYIDRPDLGFEETYSDREEFYREMLKRLEDRNVVSEEPLGNRDVLSYSGPNSQGYWRLLLEPKDLIAGPVESRETREAYAFDDYETDLEGVFVKDVEEERFRMTGNDRYVQYDKVHYAFGTDQRSVKFAVLPILYDKIREKFADNN